jgi:hypothetical protein
MEVEPLWRARLAWRFRGALQWPAFVVLTGADGLLIHLRPIAGDGRTDLLGALLLAGFFNLVGVAVFAPVLAWLLRRRRRDLPRIIAEDHMGVAVLLAITAAIAVGGTVHAPVRAEAERDMVAQARAAATYIRRHAPAEYRGHLRRATTVKAEDERYRTCVPGADPDRWFCVYVDTSIDPPGVTRDPSGESNASFTGATAVGPR